MIIRIRLDLPSEAAYVSLCRTVTQTLLCQLGVVQEDVENVELVVGEVCANAVQHAYDNPDERYEVELAFSRDKIDVTVRDHGKGADPGLWNQDPTELRERGRGMLLVKAIADRFDFEVQDGTTIHVCIKLRYKTQQDQDRADAMDLQGASMVSL